MIPHARGAGLVIRLTLVIVALVIIVRVSPSLRELLPFAAAAAGPFAGPTSSQPIALTADDGLLAVVNPDNNSVTFFDVRGDVNQKLAEVPVQTEPNGVAFSRAGDRAYVANTVSGTVSVININLANGVISKPRVHIRVGTEPYGLAFTPNGTKLYVTNARSQSISVIDPATNTVVRTIFNAGLEPRGIAITNDGDDDDADEKVFVTQFLSQPVGGGVLDGADNSKVGRVTVLSTATDTVIGTVQLNPLTDTGFAATGDALARIPPGSGTFITGAYPNQLNNIAIKGGTAFVPNTGASPNGPINFDVNTQSLLSTIDVATNTEAATALNMHTAVRDQMNPNKLFITQPWAIAFEHNTPVGFVLSAASNHAIKLQVTGAAAQVLVNPDDPTAVLQIPTGKNPRGLVVNTADTRAYVMNYVSRDVTVIDLTTTPERVMGGALASAALPAAGSQADVIQVGKELYHTSIGVFDPATPGGDPIVGRMSRNGWGSCAACHPNGLSDNVVWIFASGPRRTIPQHTDFDLTDPNRVAMRALNWSGIFDEEQDFELNIRGVSGGLGLFVQADGVTPDNTPPVAAFDPANGPPNTTRRQLTVRGVGAWDAIKAFEQFGIRPPISPVSKTEPDVIAGRALFIAANCQQCHGGPQWTSGRVRFTPPPAAGVVVNGQIIGELRKVGTFDPTAFNEVRANGAVPPLGTDGFVPASLLSIGAFSGAFLHNGGVGSLDGVLNNVTHRSAGTGGVDTLTNPADRQKITRFLQSIDAASAPIP